MINVVTIIGFLGKDPVIGESRATTYAHLSVAVNEVWTDANAERHERVTWVPVVAFNGLAKSLRQLAQGDQIAVAGKLQTNTFETDDGKRTRLEVIAGSIDFLRIKSWSEKREKP